MGLASKLAAAQANQGAPAYPGGPPVGGSAPPGGSGGYPGQQQYSGQPQQQQFQAYPGGQQQQGPPGQGRPGQQSGPGPSPYPGQSSYPGQQGPPQGQYGGPGPQGGAPMGAVSQNSGAYKQLLMSCIQEKGLQNFYPPNSPVLDQIANRAASQVQQLAAQWRINAEIASDIVKLALYDVILYVDDSGSMAFEENGERIDDLKLILNRVAFATSLFDEDGIQVRFMNSTVQGNNIRGQQQVEQMIQQTKFQGLTPMGRELQNKVLGPLVLGPARSGQLRKPVLVITITDGQPTGESTRDISGIILNASRELQSNPRCGRGAVAFQFAQVGNDLKAREFLKQLDEDRSIGDIIDCTSNFEVEQDEMKNSVPPVDLTPELWLIKLLLGSIDSSYDKKDESTSGQGPPMGQQYGGPGGPGGYGGPGMQGGQGGYPPPQQYGGGAPGGYPPQGNYGGPGGQQQQQYGRPPPGPPGQQGGYGAPPRY